MSDTIELQPILSKPYKTDGQNRIYIPKAFREFLDGKETDYELIFCKDNQILIRKKKNINIQYE